MASGEVAVDDAVHIGPLSAQSYDDAMEALRARFLNRGPMASCRASFPKSTAPPDSAGFCLGANCVRARNR
ncbi:hypothetical protein BN2476_890005 [Paraburkholderia piptadeniae]|uniref:Uncharacterized protein n=1 Tax=Paraburkholderia piptadeniae TaxID=1701573 RepID=A0A1N7STK0_9BURK|nr:hypothetical protein BN2476_890005 [Paraburkholderia piptadeniae]